ncbi:MAG: hypothetical protein K8S97_06015 [Anaerolineae bacterium]|nr:hypothetical protein [Anaerolineae bacterium]
MQHRTRIAHVMFLIGLSLLLLGLEGCGNDNDSGNGDADNEAPETAPVTDEAAPAIDPADRAQVQTQYESLTTAQQTLADIWRGVWDGEEVPCDTALPPLLNPESITQFTDPPLSEIAVLLRRAAIELDRAMTLWTVECESPRNLPPVDIAREGRDKTLFAGDALREAQTLLDTLP